MRRWLVTPLVMLAVLTLTQSVAWATSSTADANVYRTDTSECTRAHGYINNTSGRPHIDSYARATFYAANLQTPCYYGETLGPYQIAVREDLYRWTGSQWGVCNTGPWIENPRSAQQVNTGWNPWLPCGPGYYMMVVYAFIYNNGWLGGSTATGYVYAS